MNNFHKTDDFAAEIISKGCFCDDNPNFRGAVYLIETTVLRLNPVACNEWLPTVALNGRNSYDTEEEWQKYCKDKEAMQKAFEDKIAAICGYDSSAGSISVTQSVSEIFTVVYIHKIKEGEKEEDE